MTSRFETVLGYAKERYSEEQDRFCQIDTKCGTLISMLTVSVGVFAGVLGIYSEVFLPPKSTVNWVMLVTVVLTFLFMVGAWHRALQAIKLTYAAVAPNDHRTIEYLRTTEYVEFQNHLLSCYIDSTKEMGRLIEQKVHHLELVYWRLKLMIWTFGALFFDHSHRRVSRMTKKDEKPAQPPPSNAGTQQKPEKPPAVQYVKKSDNSKPTKRG